ncbi:MAG: exonuclease domain-containing protein [Anaerolineae bacterium]|nr:exonuclease domain-containing protein [Anaerolineae bacterium]
MAGKLDRIIVIDLEATCWDGPTPPDQESEIIEVGVCMLDVKTGERSQKQSIIVKPERSRVSEFCTELTTLTQADVEHGVSFEHACQILRRKFRVRDRTWASYGDYDRRQFIKQCDQKGIKYPLSATHINVKNMMAVLYGLHSEVGLVQAMAIMDLPLEGIHHRGHDDAWNIAALLAKMLQQWRNGH